MHELLHHLGTALATSAFLMEYLVLENFEQRSGGARKLEAREEKKNKSVPVFNVRSFTYTKLRVFCGTLVRIKKSLR